MKKPITNQNTNQDKPKQFSVAQFWKERAEFFLNDEHAADFMAEIKADEYLEFIMNNKSVISSKEWYYPLGISKTQFYRWKTGNKKFERVHAMCQGIMGIRREKMMIDKSNNPHPIAHLQHLYDEDWDSANYYHAALRKKDDDKKSGDVHVYITKDEKTDEVPERK